MSEVFPPLSSVAQVLRTRGSRIFAFRFRFLALAALFSAVVGAAAAAENPWRAPDSGRLLATAGVGQIEGAGGAGLSPMALITGYGSERSVGANARYTHIYLTDVTARSAGISVGFFDRFEVSYARLALDTRSAGAALGLGDGFTIGQNIVGAKLRLIGDAIYDQDRLLPQIAVGAQWKSTNNAALLGALGAQRAEDFDYYIAATKLFLDQSLLLSGAVRMTRANQFGLLGYGGDQGDRRRPQFEGAAAVLLRRNLAAGAEYRTRPDNLGFAREEDAYDVFLAWFPNKTVSFTGAYVDLGDVALQGPQRGPYLSVQVGF